MEMNYKAKVAMGIAIFLTTILLASVVTFGFAMASPVDEVTSKANSVGSSVGVNVDVDSDTSTNNGNSQASVKSSTNTNTNTNAGSDVNANSNSNTKINANVGKDSNSASVRASVEAKSSTDESVSVDLDSIERNEISSNEIESTIGETLSSNLKKIGFAHVIRGVGSIDNGTNGHLIATVWVSQKFASVTNGNIEDNTTLKTFGVIKISSQKYKLVRFSSENSNELNFYVLPINTRVNSDSNLEAQAVGTLNLEKSLDLVSFTKWDGKLVLNSGKHQGTWNVDLSTDSFTLKPHKARINSSAEAQTTFKAEADVSQNLSESSAANVNVDADLNAEAKVKPKIGFWKRIFSWGN